MKKTYYSTCTYIHELIVHIKHDRLAGGLERQSAFGATGKGESWADGFKWSVENVALGVGKRVAPDWCNGNAHRHAQQQLRSVKFVQKIVDRPTHIHRVEHAYVTHMSETRQECTLLRARFTCTQCGGACLCTIASIIRQ